MMATCSAVSDAQWLQAARALLGDAADDGLRLLGVEPTQRAPEAAPEDGEEPGASRAVQVRVCWAAELRRLPLFVRPAPEPDGPDELDGPEELERPEDALEKERDLFALLARLTPRLPRAAQQALQERPWGPRFLLATPRALLFEDLSAQGFRSAGARAALDFAQCAAALEALARLHGASLALEEGDRRARRPTPWRLGERFPQPLREAAFCAAPPAALPALRALLLRMHEFKDSPRLPDVLRRLEELPRLAQELVRASEKHRNVVCHGLPSSRHILLRYSSWGQVEDARLVGLGRCRYAPPGLDVSALLHLCTRRPLREARGAELRDLYHAALARALSGAGAEGLVPRAAFDASWGDCAAFGPVAAACALPAALLPALVPRAQRRSPDRLAELVLAEFERDADYRERVGEAVADLVHKVLLKK